MAAEMTPTVTIALTEYNNLRDNVKNLTAQVSELEKKNSSLKTGAKAIVRKVTTDFTREDYDYYYRTGIDKPKEKVLEEKYVNFDDIRKKVEDHFAKELTDSIESYNQLSDEYRKKKENLKKELEDVFQKRIKSMYDDCYKVEDALNHDIYILKNKIAEAAKRLTKVRYELDGKVFRPKNEILNIDKIISYLEDTSIS